jgi:signal transduction histidine kinase
MKLSFQQLRHARVFYTLGGRLSGMLFMGVAAGSILAVSVTLTGRAFDLAVEKPASSLIDIYQKPNGEHSTTDRFSQGRPDLVTRPTVVTSWSLTGSILLLFAQLIAISALVWLARQLILKFGPYILASCLSFRPANPGLNLLEAASDRGTESVLFGQEKAEMLAAISHDLQTPLTRLRLRIDTLTEGEMRERLLHDVKEIQRLIEQGILYAKATRTTEVNTLVDLSAFASNLALSYGSEGSIVVANKAASLNILTKPTALRTIISILIDNALRFAGSAEILVARNRSGRAVIQVLDHGPGIPEGELVSVLRPFYRLEMSRNRDTGGSGLGLAIANELSRTMNARLTLRNREPGGLIAQLAFED